MNRIDKKFRELKKQKKPALIVYITAGYPNLSKTKELILEIEKGGADIIELGIPFSDPLADGPTIQLASQRALKNNVSLESVISLVKDIRKKTHIPLVFMTYYNPVFHYGVAGFVKEAARAGVDGVIIPDLPPEEAGALIKSAKKEKFATIFLLTPTSVRKRMKLVSKASTGFVYYVSLTGTTGARHLLPTDLKNKLRSIKRFTKNPVCVGFGVSSPSQAAEISKSADGVIVGSAIIDLMHKNIGKKDMVRKTAGFVRGLKNAMR